MKRKSSWLTLLWRQFCEYCGRTALHGYQYVTEPNRHTMERLLWICVHCCAITGASLMIYSTWIRYEESPTVTTVETTHFPVWNLPFPAVTVCDSNQIQISRARRLAKRMSAGNTILEQDLFEDMRYLRQIIMHGFLPFANVSRLQQHLTKMGLSMEQAMSEVAPDCNDILAECRWKNEKRSCMSLFTKTKSDNGFCCSFNYDPDVFCNTNSKAVKSNQVAAPQYVTAAGYQFGLSVLLRYFPDERYGSTISTGAFRVLLHSWFEFPGQWATSEALVRRQSYAVFRVDVESTYASPALRSLDFKKRGCVFYIEEASNRKPKEFPERYSQFNCLIECRNQYVQDLCGCHPYYYPESANKTRICHFGDLECLERIKGLLSRVTTIIDDRDENPQRHASMKCPCPPPCQENSYRYEATSGELLLDDYADIAEMSNLEDPANYSVFNVYYGQMTATRYRKDVLFSWDTLLSNAGGLCGLFMGFSIISIVEFVYFFTIRLYFMLQRNTKRKKKTKERKLKDMPGFLRARPAWIDHRARRPAYYY